LDKATILTVGPRHMIIHFGSWHLWLKACG